MGDGIQRGLSLTCVWPQGYLWKRGHLRRNWAERWFQLQPSCLCYFSSEECKEKRGTIPLDAHCCVEVRRSKGGGKGDLMFLLRLGPSGSNTQNGCLEVSLILSAVFPFVVLVVKPGASRLTGRCSTAAARGQHVKETKTTNCMPSHWGSIKLPQSSEAVTLSDTSQHIFPVLFLIFSFDIGFLVV